MVRRSLPSPRPVTGPRVGSRPSARAWGALGLLLFAWGALGASCAEGALAIMPGVINDPSNRSLRQAILSFATGQICTELQARTIPLALRPEEPALGRFFPTSCAVQELPSGNLFVRFSGHGYGWSNVSGRIGFEAAAAVEYRHDFLLGDAGMYVYFRQQRTESSEFRVLMVERGAAVPAGGLAGVAIAQVLGSSVASAVQQIGAQILRHQLAQGFTVLRAEDGTVSFSLGVLEKGARPPVPFERGESDWPLLANERTELHVGQRDYTGPYRIEDEDEALHLTAVLEGAPAVDVLVVSLAIGNEWVQGYEHQPVAPSPPVSPVFEAVLEVARAVPNRPPAPWRRAVRLPPGSYYVVFDHTPAAGRTVPPAATFDDRAALVSYAVQLGDLP